MRAETLPSPTRSRVVALVSAAALILAGGQVGADAATAEDRGITAACDERTQQAAAEFADVESGLTHAGAIGCLVAYRVAQGKFVDGARIFEPGSHVTRQQMATFVAHTLDRLPAAQFELPVATGDLDVVDAASISVAHQANVERLHRAGIVAGYPDGTFRPGEPIDRAQMASFLARALQAAVGTELPRTEVFDDVEGPHRASIERLAAIGVVGGTTGSTYEPSAPTTRAQMATMIARSLDYLVTEGLMEPVAYARGTATASLAVVGVETERHEDFDRVTFTLDGDEGLAGWEVRQVDHPVAHGSGTEVDVDGATVLEVNLTGMALPPEHDEPAWDADRTVIDGDGVVEMVNQHVYEGRHQVFLGTTGPGSFSVDREADPQRVVVDVAHAG
jgi:hypothetical protein